jgi:hypothetical protein
MTSARKADSATAALIVRAFQRNTEFTPLREMGRRDLCALSIEIDALADLPHSGIRRRFLCNQMIDDVNFILGIG